MRRNMTPPAWFKLTDYQICKDFNIIEWHINIQLRAEFLLSIYNPHLFIEKLRQKNKIDAINFINNNYDAFLNNRKKFLTKKDLKQTINSWIEHRKQEKTPGVRPLNAYEIRAFYLRDIQNSDSNSIVTDVLLINLNLSEEQLQNEFNAYIRKIKKEILPENASSKRKYLNIIEHEFTPKDFHRWRSNAILPYMDLKILSLKTGVKINDNALSRILNLDLNKIRGDCKPLIKRILTLDYTGNLYAQACQML